MRTIADAIIATDGEREAPDTSKIAKGAKGAKPAAAGDQAEGKSGSLLGRFDLKKLLPSKSRVAAAD